MKKAVIILAITTVFFFCLWIGAIKEHYDRMEERCRCYAEDKLYKMKSDLLEELSGLEED